jgi:hypothetical protein
LGFCWESLPVPIKPPETKANAYTKIREQIDLVTGCSRAFVSGGFIEYFRLIESDSYLDFFSNLTLASSSSDSFMPSFPISSNLECASMIELI